MVYIKKKIIFGITSLTLGGAERVLVDISNKLCDLYEVTIFSIYDNGELKRELNKNIQFKSLYDCKYENLNIFKKTLVPFYFFFFSNFIYKKYIKGKYDVEISFLEGPITRLFSKKGNSSKKITWVHNDIKYVFGKGVKSYFKKWIDKKIYKKYDNIVFVSKENMKSFQSEYKGIDKSKMSVIYNYINASLVKEKAEKFSTEISDYTTKRFVTVCRLVKQKAIDRLIRVHKKIIDDGKIHDFFVIGDGPERENLEEAVRINGIENTFHFLGKKENPYPYIKEADYFCLLSYFEGYGMVLEEAKILNKKIIITDTAAREGFNDYESVLILQNNEKSIYNGISDVINGKITISASRKGIDNGKNIDKIIELIEK